MPMEGGACFVHKVVRHFFFFLIIKSNIIKNAKRNQVHLEYKRKASKKKKKTKQRNH
jgi:hypothetical protein